MPHPSLLKSGVPLWFVTVIGCLSFVRVVMDKADRERGLPTMATDLGLSVTGQQRVTEQFFKARRVQPELPHG